MDFKRKATFIVNEIYMGFYFPSSKYKKRSIDVKKQNKMNFRSIKIWLKIKP